MDSAGVEVGRAGKAADVRSEDLHVRPS
jgi:hypothetical protein